MMFFPFCILNIIEIFESTMYIRNVVYNIKKSRFNTNQSMSHAEMKNHVSNVYYKSSVEKEDLFHEFRL